MRVINALPFSASVSFIWRTGGMSDILGTATDEPAIKQAKFILSVESNVFL